MENEQPPLVSASLSVRPPAIHARRWAVTFKLLFIAALVLLLQLPLVLINQLRKERSFNREQAYARQAAAVVSQAERSGARVDGGAETSTTYNPARAAAEGYRMVERSLKHGMLVLTLVFSAFFLFETLAGLRLHAVHYGLVGAALCLFYLALLALGEVLSPGLAYIGAAAASSLLIVCYCITILRSSARAGLIAAFLAAEHGVLYVVLRMEDYALLAGTASLFVVLAGIMFFTRRVDWFAQEAGREAQT